jgi:hypothetical protein
MERSMYLLYMPVGCGILCCYWRARVSCLSINLVSSWSYGTYLLCHTALTISLCTCLDYFSSCPPAEKGPSPGLLTVSCVPRPWRSSTGVQARIPRRDGSSQRPGGSPPARPRARASIHRCDTCAHVLVVGQCRWPCSYMINQIEVAIIALKKNIQRGNR